MKQARDSDAFSRFNCTDCGERIGFGMVGRCIACILKSIPWKEGDQVRVNGRLGKVVYVYYNGFTLVQFPNEPIEGGIFNNNGTYRNSEIAVLGRAVCQIE